MDEDDHDPDRLVAAALRGDASSRDELLRQVRASVLRYALARGLPDADAQDLAQDVCIGLLKAMPGWTDQGRPLWAYVFAIARNKFADRTRAHYARKEVPMGEESAFLFDTADPRPGPEALAEADDGTAEMRRLLSTLPTTQREVLLLRVAVGLSAAETAAVLELTPGSVRVIQHRAVGALRSRLATAAGGAL